MKYDAQLSEVTKLLPSAQSILIALPASATVDELAAGLALFLSLEQAGKEAAIITEGVIRVGHTNLFGVGEIQSKIPETSGGDFVVTLEGVAMTGADGKGSVPSLEKLDYYTQGSNLNLVFKVIPGQKFDPTGIISHHDGQGFNLVFVLGATNFSELGSLYNANQQLFSGTHLVNIDNGGGNAQFGATNIVDGGASSVSEIISQLLPALGLPVNGDIATNILSGIFAATSDLQKRNTGADTYEAVAQALRAGGQKPFRGGPGSGQQGQFQGQGNRPVNVPQNQNQPAGASQQKPATGFDLNKVFNIPPQNDNFTVPPVVGSTPVEMEPEPQPSPEESVAGEEVVTPEEDWLTPKIFKGKGSIG